MSARVIEVTLSVADHNALVDMSDEERSRWMQRLLDGYVYDDPMPCSAGGIWDTTMLVLEEKLGSRSYIAIVPPERWTFEKQPPVGTGSRAGDSTT